MVMLSLYGLDFTYHNRSSAKIHIEESDRELILRNELANLKFFAEEFLFGSGYVSSELDDFYNDFIMRCYEDLSLDYIAQIILEVKEGDIAAAMAIIYAEEDI